MIDTHREREREAETQAEGEAGSMHREPDVRFNPGSPGSRSGPKAGAKPLRHPGIPAIVYLRFKFNCESFPYDFSCILKTLGFYRIVPPYFIKMPFYIVYY